MQHKHPADIRPALLSWAIERAGVPVLDLATAVGTSEDVVSHWLSGDRQPSFRQARSIATKLRVPFGFLFLEEPPAESLPIPDFRTVDGESVQKISTNLRDLLYAVMRKQEWLSDYLRESGANPIDIVGRLFSETNSSILASDIRERLSLGSERDRPANAEAFLRELVRKCERSGVSVLRSGIVGNNTQRKLDVSEFRGFCLSDPYAPLIFINSVDAPQAQIFTLIHELAHIWRGDTGISGGLQQASAEVERLCNHVAADVLVPAGSFSEFWNADLEASEAVRLASQHFRISRYVVAIRAFESGFINRATLNGLLDRYRAEAQPRAPERGGGDFYRTLISRNGRVITEGVVDAVGRQRVLIRDAAGLLDAKPSQLGRIAREIQGAA